jgi:hypothetical protein
MGCVSNPFILIQVHWLNDYSKEKGGPTLIWSDIQSSCFDAVGDVLLILDCCHATLFTKGQKLQGRFEVLVACAKGLGTPGPGEGSFTWALMQVLNGDIIEKGITAKELRASMDDLTRGWSHVYCGIMELMSPTQKLRFGTQFPQKV